MKKRLIATTIISFVLATTAFAWALTRNTVDLENVGKSRLWKYDSEHVGVQRTIPDANGKDIVIFAAMPFRLKAALAGLAVAQAEYEFWDMNSVEAIRFVAKKRVVATVKLAIAQAKVNKFAGAIDE